jgi:hypothetical protein
MDGELFVDTESPFDKLRMRIIEIPYQRTKTYPRFEKHFSSQSAESFSQTVR